MNAKFDARSLDHRLLQTLRQRAVAGVDEGCRLACASLRGVLGRCASTDQEEE